MISRVAKKLALIMSVAALALAFTATPAHAKTVLSQGTTDTYSWVIDDEGIVYIYPTDAASDDTSSVTDTDGLTYKLYTYGSLQIVYVGTTAANDSISNSASMFESSASVASDTNTIYDGTYGSTAYARVDLTTDTETTTLEDATTTHAPGWAYEDGAYRYYEPDGTLRTNARVSADGDWYYFDAEGALAQGKWIEYNGAYYYFGKDGKLVTNTEYEYGDTVYTFDATGRCTTSPVSDGTLDAVVNACYYTPSTGSGGCAAWVSNVFRNAGIGEWHGNACDFYYSYCTSTDLSDLQPGMIIAVGSCAGTAASRAYGHVGIYVGNGIVMQNLLGTVGSMTLDTWLSYFDGYSTPAWGWLGGVVLS